ncbi:hypothetical protein NSU_2271 [Novosphingobium pentaromativorans US6-1]|uniref:Uncharacterized protein n=1 Tax=Novosphingobium pentaromativorans US6-1 TaxID=1088721 RepID=G6ED50_9SPHN|nr:hypothetical protein NSU_2271 [Novosphingobium pentaromativorans US6-1]
MSSGRQCGIASSPLVFFFLHNHETICVEGARLAATASGRI